MTTEGSAGAKSLKSRFEDMALNKSYVTDRKKPIETGKDTRSSQIEETTTTSTEDVVVDRTEQVSPTPQTPEPVAPISHRAEPVSPISHRVEPVAPISHRVDPVAPISQTEEPVALIEDTNQEVDDSETYDYPPQRELPVKVQAEETITKIEDSSSKAPVAKAIYDYAAGLFNHHHQFYIYNLYLFLVNKI